VRSSRPGAPGHAPLVDFCNRNDLQARPADLETRRRLGGDRVSGSVFGDEGHSTFAELLVLGETGPRSIAHRRFLHADESIDREPRIHGSGAVECIAIIDCVAGLLRDDRSSWRLRPNPIGSNTSCRAARVDYDRSTVIEPSSPPAKPLERIRGVRPRIPACASASGEGRLPHPFAKRRCVPLHPRCFPSQDFPLRGVPVSHSLYPTCGDKGPRLFYLRA